MLRQAQHDKKKLSVTRKKSAQGAENSASMAASASSASVWTSASIAARMRSGVIGRSVSHAPVASWIAAATAGANGTSGISATPRAPYGPFGSASSMMIGTISAGMSSAVGKRYVLKYGVSTLPSRTSKFSVSA